MGLGQHTLEQQVDEDRPLRGDAPALGHADAPGVARVNALIARGKPSPREVAAIIEAHPTEQAAIVQLLQSTLGNHFTSQVFGDAAPTHALAEPVAEPPANVDPAGPLGDATDVDPAQVAAEQIGHGADDENKITNEVFWQRHPALRGIKLTAGTAAADEWLRLRDLHVRPALARKPAPTQAEERPVKAAVAEVPVAPPVTETELAPPTLERGIPGPELAKTVAEHVDAQPAVKAQPAQEAQPKAPLAEPEVATETAKAQSTDPAIAALLAWQPTEVGGEQGQAAWLLAAIDTKLIGAFAQTKEQLKRLAEGHATVMSQEDKPDAVRSPAKNVKHVKDTKGGQAIYSIAMADTPILGVLCTLATSRIQQWIDEGSPKVKMLFQLGTMARGDMGFKFHSRHAQGSAIDLNFGDGDANKKAFGREEDVIALLDGLEPGKIGSVFPDNDNHIHLAVNGGKYEIGLPFQGPFFPKEKSIDAAKKVAEKKHPNPAVGDTIEATGMAVYTSALNNKAVAKYGEWKGVTKWWWGPTKSGSGGGARDKLKSQNLKDLLDKLEAGGDGHVPTAMAEDGHTEDTEEPAPVAPTVPDRKPGPWQSERPAEARGVDMKTDATDQKLDEHEPEKCKADCGHDHG
jgi:hypothetical protein